MEKSLPVQRFLTRMPSGRLQPAQGDATLCGAMVDIGGDGFAKRIEPIRLGGRLSQCCPLD
jgi:calcineurin-like phosphoesterase